MDRKRVRSVAKSTPRLRIAATLAERGRTEQPLKGGNDKSMPTPDTPNETLTKFDSGGTPGKNESPGGSPIFEPFNEPSIPSKPPSVYEMLLKQEQTTERKSSRASVASAAAASFPTTETSATPAEPASTGNTWRQPRTVREFAAQTNAVATKVLLGEMDLETARVYSGLARTVAQAMSTEVSRARFLAQEPDLSLEGDE